MKRVFSPDATLAERKELQQTNTELLQAMADFLEQQVASGAPVPASVSDVVNKRAAIKQRYRRN